MAVTVPAGEQSMSDKFFGEISSLSPDDDVSYALKFTTFSPAELKMAVVHRSQLSLLDPEWSSSGVYILLERPTSDGSWKGYVGKSAAAKGVRSRIGNHLSTKSWERVLAVCPEGKEWDEAEVAWLESRLYLLLLNSSNVEMRNSQPVSEGRLSEERQLRINKVTQTIASVLSVIGHTVHHEGLRNRAVRATLREHKSSDGIKALAARNTVSVKKLLDAGLLVAGEALTPTEGGYSSTMTVDADGSLVGDDGHKHRSPTAAVTEVTGEWSPPWAFWQRANGQTLDDLRAEYLLLEDRPDRASAKSMSDVTIKTLVDEGLLQAGDHLVPIGESYQGSFAVVQEDGSLRDGNGIVHNTPSGAFKSVAGYAGRNGWICWKRDDGMTLAEIREAYVTSRQPSHN